MDTSELIIAQTKKWITDVVVGCNFCPFANKVFRQNTIHYQVENSAVLKECMHAFLEECMLLDADKMIETGLLIFPNAFPKFNDYLDAVAVAENILKKAGYEGIYQVASFHPLYRFANTASDDPSNYTNRSVYPMLHLLREERLEEALLHFPDADKIPGKNIKFSREKGIAYMKMLRDACL